MKAKWEWECIIIDDDKAQYLMPTFHDNELTKRFIGVINAHDDLVAALKGMLERYPNNFGDEQPKTGACHHYAETCRSCEGLVTAWKADRAARAALKLAGAE